MVPIYLDKINLEFNFDLLIRLSTSIIEFMCCLVRTDVNLQFTQ